MELEKAYLEVLQAEKKTQAFVGEKPRETWDFYLILVLKNKGHAYIYRGLCRLKTVF